MGLVWGGIGSDKSFFMAGSINWLFEEPPPFVSNLFVHLGSRTHDLKIKSLLLYRLSLPGTPGGTLLHQLVDDRLVSFLGRPVSLWRRSGWMSPAAVGWV